MTRAQAAFRLVLLSAIFPLSVFPFAGRWDWIMAWAVVAAMIIATCVSRLLAHPDLINERASSLRADNTKPWDKLLAPAMAITPLLELMVAGLDERYHWSAPLASGLQIAGLALVITGYAIGTWAMVTNPFFSSLVRIQTDRGHHVIDRGPYAIVRHPGYTGNLIACLGFPLALSSLWAFVAVGLVTIVTVARTQLEDRTLQEELPGYVEFSRRTRFRLLPGVW